MFLQIAQGLQVVALVLADPAFVDFVNGDGIEVVQFFAAVPDGRDKIGALEQVEVLGYGLTCHVEVRAQVGQRLPAALVEHIEQFAAAGIGQGFKHVIHDAGNIGNQTVACQRRMKNCRKMSFQCPGWAAPFVIALKRHTGRLPVPSTQAIPTIMNTNLDPPPHVDGYLLLFRNTEWGRGDYSAEEIQQIMDGVTAWFERLQREGKWGGGHPLMERAKLVSGEGGRSVTDGPFPEAKEAISGYVVLNVNSMEEAVAVARANPMLKYGLTTEVREIASDCPSMYRARQKLAAAAQPA